MEGLLEGMAHVSPVLNSTAPAGIRQGLRSDQEKHRLACPPGVRGEHEGEAAQMDHLLVSQCGLFHYLVDLKEFGRKY